jgi:hypothetical protein
MLHYDFGSCDIYQDHTGEVIIMFKDGHYCPVTPNIEHEYHAVKLGISKNEFCLLHELAHQVLAFSEGLPYCPIVYNSAHSLPMPEDANLREWKITALTYYALNKPQHDSNGLQALAQISNANACAEKLLTLFLI